MVLEWGSFCIISLLESELCSLLRFWMELVCFIYHEFIVVFCVWVFLNRANVVKL